MPGLSWAAVPLPKAIRRLTPDRLRHDVRLRALGVGSGLIPPRLMHTRPEADLLAETIESVGRDRISADALAMAARFISDDGTGAAA